MPVIAERAWAPGPAHPRLAEGAVHVWRVELTAVSADLVELLCEEERTRAERLLSKRDRRLWMRSRGVLRALLGRYLQMDPSTLDFATEAHGKPELVDDATGSAGASASRSASPPGPSFNLSHSGRLAVYALAEAGAVGVDVEVARRPINEVALAERAFGPAEARRLAELEPAMRKREFLGLWVRREAELKCRGTGFGGAGAGDAGGREPWIAELEVGPRAAAAVAVQRAPRELHCWDWQI